jgi:uncharacterized protein
MKVLFFVDTHGMEEFMPELRYKARNADLLVCAGDFTIFENNIGALLAQLNSMEKKILIIPGNHEGASTIIAEAGGMQNIKCIHGSHHVEGDIIFLGYGGGGFAIEDHKFDIVAENFMKELKKLEQETGKKYRIVLVTHAPPYGVSIDDLGTHVGCRNFTAFIKRHRPILSVSGHIHEYAGAEDQLGDTRVINPGPRGIMIEL